MRVIDSFPQMGRAFERGEFSITAWRRYAAEISPALPEKLEADAAEYDFAGAVLPVLQQFYQKSEQAALAHASFQKLVGGLAEKFCSVLGSAPEADVILCLGLCNGAGWATSLDGRDAVLLGIEKIIELNWQDESAMPALIFHEIGHIWHKTYGNLYPEARSEGENSLAQLYQEGLAMVCEHILCQDDRYYHQNQNGWLDWCKENEAEIKREYLRRVDKNISTQDFFGDWCSYKNHSDVGYYLGCEFVKYLQRQYSLVDIASLNVNQLYNHFKEFASAE